MILVVSPARTVTEVSALLDPIASVTLESLDDRVKDDDVSKELLELVDASPAEDDCTGSEELPGWASADEPGTSTEELDSSTGAALLLSSPQATNPMAMETSIAGNANRFILTS